MGIILSEELCAYLETHRVGYLATADAKGQPHVVPIVFVASADGIMFVVDEKPKRAKGTGLKRMRNIAANPQVAFLVEEYSEDWDRLGYALVRGRALIVDRDTPFYRAVLARLRERYPQYVPMKLRPDENPVVHIQPDHVHRWRAQR